MSTCIYYQDRPELTFNKAEHIIPAGIGGQHKLPKGYVSDQFNNDISKIEMAFMRQSIIAMPRQMVGPGKRGKTTKPTRSPVMVIIQPGPPERYALGYLSLARAIHLPQIRINTVSGEINFAVPITMEADPDAYLLKELQRFYDSRPYYIPETKLPENEILIGFDDMLYIAHHPSHSFKLTPEVIAELSNSLITDNRVYQQSNQNVSFQQVAVIADDFYRVTAKIAMNTLAHLKGRAFLSDEAFDPLRLYITEGGINPGLTFIPKPGRMPQVPPDAHHLMFAVIKDKLLVNVCFYNHFTVNITLPAAFGDAFQPVGYLCDWRNKQEMAF